MYGHEKDVSYGCAQIPRHKLQGFHQRVEKRGALLCYAKHAVFAPSDCYFRLLEAKQPPRAMGTANCKYDILFPLIYEEPVEVVQK
jgi:hypothetical protein